jgi:hypothetical protein
MTNTVTETPTQVTSKPEVDLDDRIDRVRDAVYALDSAVDELVRSLTALDDEDIPESVRDLASVMSHDAEEVQYEFDRGDFFTQVAELQELADKEDEDDEEAAS